MRLYSRAEDISVKRRTEQVVKLLAHLSIDDKTALDIGCGYGSQALTIAQMAKRVIGIDIKEELIREAQENRTRLKASAEFIRASAECLPFRDSCCDIVMILEALEHVQNEEIALKETRRVLKSSGYLVVSVPNKLYPFEMHYVKIGKVVFHGFYGSVPFFSWLPHLIRKRFETARIYTKKEIMDIIQKNGFLIHQVQYSPYPRLDRVGSKRLTNFLDRFFAHLENNTFFKRFGMSIFVLAQKREG